MVLFKIFLLNQCPLIISLLWLNFEFYCVLQKTLIFLKLASTQKSISFVSERNTKLRWLLCESIPLAVTNSSWFYLCDPDLRQGVKQMEEKRFIIVIISTYKWAGITAEKNVTLLNTTVIKYRHFQNPTERIAISKRPVSVLYESRDSYISVWIQFVIICVWTLKFGRLSTCEKHSNRGHLFRNCISKRWSQHFPRKKLLFAVFGKINKHWIPYKN